MLPAAGAAIVGAMSQYPDSLRLPREAPEGRVTAVLGPTNTGKTHYALERMLAHPTGMIGLPLRLLAREIYDRVAAAKGAESVALITGEERIVPRAPRFWVATVESMPLDIRTSFLAIDEIQLCADPDRGHVFTDRLLHGRGEDETLFLGATTMHGLIRRLVPHCQFMSRERLSDLAYAGSRKITRLPRRSAIVAFSIDDVYAIAELIRRQRGGAAVVMGALSPRTRNAQVALYQSGDVDFLVATDAIGMGLNMDVDHVAFASLDKFDGEHMRALRPQELAQIAGRAGRYMNDGTFGVTGDAREIDASVVEEIENHHFEPVRMAQWRNPSPTFISLPTLIESLEATPVQRGLQRVRAQIDLNSLRLCANDPEIAGLATSPDAVRRLWEACQIPDFRKATAEEHVRLVKRIFGFLQSADGVIPADYMEREVRQLDSGEGDIDLIGQRIAQIRTWTYAANRAHWLKDAARWQAETRAVEDRLSDALHEKLTQRFIDRRTSVLMKRLRAGEEFAAIIGDEGEVTVDGEYVGRLNGLVFAPDPRADGPHGKALRSAALRGLQGEIATRAFAIAKAADNEITLSEHGKLWWDGSAIARLEPGPTPLTPRVVLIADDRATPTAYARAQGRMREWVENQVKRRLAPLAKITLALEREAAAPKGFVAGARGMAFRLLEGMGYIDRANVRDEAKALTPSERGALKILGLRFGRFSLYMPALVKPEAARLKALLTAIAARAPRLPELPAPGLTSFVVDGATAPEIYQAMGYRVFGTRAVRFDILEKLGDLIEAQRSADKLLKPFAITPQMMSVLGCNIADAGAVLDGLGFRMQPVTGEDGVSRELWRPRRRAGDPSTGARERRPRRPNQTPAAMEAVPGTPAEGGAEAAAPTSDATPAPTDGAPERRKRRRRRKPRPLQTGAQATATSPEGEIAAIAPAPTDQSAAQTAVQATPRPRGDRREGPHAERQKERRDERGPRAARPSRPAGPPREGRAPTQERRAEGMGENREHSKFRPRKPQGEREPREWRDQERAPQLDPNNPFAALAKLKDQTRT